MKNGTCPHCGKQTLGTRIRSQKVRHAGYEFFMPSAEVVACGSCDFVSVTGKELQRREEHLFKLLEEGNAEISDSKLKLMLQAISSELRTSRWRAILTAERSKLVYRTNREDPEVIFEGGGSGEKNLEYLADYITAALTFFPAAIQEIAIRREHEFPKCPECESMKISTFWAEEKVPVSPTETMLIELPVRKCESCKFEYRDYQSEQIIEEAVRKKADHG